MKESSDIPINEWLEILSYRDFYDVPRLVLAQDGKSGFWIFDSSFNDDLDEYVESYEIYFSGFDINLAKKSFEEHARGERGKVVNVVLVSSCQFDLTKRKKILVQGERKET